MSEILCWDHPIREPDCPKCRAEDYPPMTTIKEGDELARELEALKIRAVERGFRFDCSTYERTIYGLPDDLRGRILTALRQHNGATQGDEVLRDFEAHTNWELSYEYKDEEPGAWQVHSVNGGRSDREWALIGEGETPAEAMLAALSTSSPSGGMGG